MEWYASEQKMSINAPDRMVEMLSEDTDTSRLMLGENEVIDNWDPILLEYPFVRRGMTAKEYGEENQYYFSQSIEVIKSRKYCPLWKQKLKDEAEKR